MVTAYSYRDGAGADAPAHDRAGTTGYGPAQVDTTVRSLRERQVLLAGDAIGWSPSVSASILTPTLRRP